MGAVSPVAVPQNRPLKGLCWHVLQRPQQLTGERNKVYRSQFGCIHPALLRARRKRLQWGKREQRLYRRHRWRIEGVHGEAKTWHGLARAVRRGLDNMLIQAFLTAAAINLKRLAAALLAAIVGFSPKPLAEIGAGAPAELNLA
ncbi:MAG: transposase [Bosea sp. (in: a-proteobacteria)]